MYFFVPAWPHTYNLKILYFKQCISIIYHKTDTKADVDNKVTLLIIKSLDYE